jgi:hypothetical protein
MNIGQAIEALKAGNLIRRAGWNGKGMHLYLEDSLHYATGGGAHKGTERTYEPCIVMFTAQGKHQPGWLASQADLLADDWEVVGA